MPSVKMVVGTLHIQLHSNPLGVLTLKRETMIELTEEQVEQLIDTIKNPDSMKTSIALMFLEYLLEGGDT